jgi:hypothetical protein
MMRLRLQMLAPVSERYNWNRRMSSAVAISRDRLKNAANRLQLRIWPLCVPAQSLRAFRVGDAAARSVCDLGVAID